jgi:hypothetical protein
MEENTSQNTTTTTKRSPEQHKNRQLCKPQPHEPRNKQLERAGEGRRKAKQTEKRRRKTLREDPQSYKEINNKSKVSEENIQNRGQSLCLQLQ